MTMADDLLRKEGWTPAEEQPEGRISNWHPPTDTPIDESPAVYTAGQALNWVVYLAEQREAAVAAERKRGRLCIEYAYSDRGEFLGKDALIKLLESPYTEQS